MQKLTIESVFSEIFPGWRNWAFHSPEVEKMALERGEVCRTCEFLGHFVQSKRYGKKCTKCGCPIAPKVRSESSKCPENKWPI